MGEIIEVCETSRTASYEAAVLRTVVIVRYVSLDNFDTKSMDFCRSFGGPGRVNSFYNMIASRIFVMLVPLSIHTCEPYRSH